MSSEVSITEGGIVQVAPEDLRAAAARALVCVDEITTAEAHLSAAAGEMAAMTITLPVVTDVTTVRFALGQVRVKLELLATALLKAADVYEVAELMVKLEMHGVDAQAVQAQLDALIKDRPELEQDARTLIQQYRLFDITGNAMKALGFNDWSKYSLLAPAVQPKNFEVSIKETRERTSTNLRVQAPQGLEDLANRIPADDFQVSIEKYEMPDGSNRFIVSAVGTQTWLKPGGEPMDLTSNIKEFTGGDGAAAEAIRVAMRDAGIEPGDWVLLNGHSQAGMSTEMLVTEEEFGVDVGVTWGSPTERAVPDDVTFIRVEHTSDPVGWLSGADYPVPTGADDSLRIERDAPGALFTPHLMPSYVETAALADQSDDPRLMGLWDSLHELHDAERVTTTDYRIEEIIRSPLDSFRITGDLDLNEIVSELTGEAGESGGAAGLSGSGDGGGLAGPVHGDARPLAPVDDNVAAPWLT